jgi:uncharacterized membrane protein
MAFCPSCGSAVEGRFCPKCGTAVDAGAAPGGSPTPGPPPAAAGAGMTDNAAGALCYLFGVITGILFLVLAPYNQNRNVKFHAFQSIFMNIGIVVVWIALFIVSLVLHVIPILGSIIALLLHLALWIGCLVLWLYMMFKTYNGEKIVLPVVGAMAEKQAGA